MKKLFILPIIFCLTVVAQTTNNLKTSDEDSILVPKNVKVLLPESLKCDRYQHVSPWLGQCVDDIHVGTEKEWQELLQRSPKNIKPKFFIFDNYAFFTSGISMISNNLEAIESNCGVSSAILIDGQCHLQIIFSDNIKNIKCLQKNNTVICTWNPLNSNYE